MKCQQTGAAIIGLLLYQALYNLFSKYTLVLLQPLEYTFMIAHAINSSTDQYVY
jgi:hypothetical protein